MKEMDFWESDFEDADIRCEPAPGVALDRRTFLQVLGSGILITVVGSDVRGQSAASIAARLYLNEDGSITALSGKVEEGQGPRTELSQAAAEELRLPIERIRLVMSDTDLVPDDGITAGSRTTPRNVPEMRQAAATARELLVRYAAEQWKVETGSLQVSNGVLTNTANGESLSYADLAKDRQVVAAFAGSIRTDVRLTDPKDWKVLGKPVARLGGRDLVTGSHRFPSDIVRPGMAYGRILRAPSYGATLESIDLSAAGAMKDVQVFREDQVVGVVAPSSHRATQALTLLAGTAAWKTPQETVSHRTIHEHLLKHAERDAARVDESGSVTQSLSDSAKVLQETYTVSYIQHAPMEPRAAVAEWKDGRLTVWAGCDGPFRARRDLAEQFDLPEEQIRVIIPDMGGGFGGKHTAEAALEAAWLAKAAGKPVWVRWTREEEFTWAYCRPAAVVECRGGLDSKGSLVAWDFANINGGGAAVGTPYAIPNIRISTMRSDSPLPQGSYRCLGATGSNFARESFMDELAAAAAVDPLEFRLAHLENDRLRAVLQDAAERFGWKERKSRVSPSMGVGIACGTEKNSVVAACVEVAMDREGGTFRVVEICETFECGPVLNPDNLMSQVQGCIVMGLGGALTEEIEFEEGRILNPSFSRYRVPRFQDVPRIHVHLKNNPDIPPAGGGETPIIPVAPAIANAVFAATGVRIRSMPLRTEALRKV